MVNSDPLNGVLGVTVEQVGMSIIMHLLDVNYCLHVPYIPAKTARDPRQHDMLANF